MGLERENAFPGPTPGLTPGLTAVWGWDGTPLEKIIFRRNSEKLAQLYPGVSPGVELGKDPEKP